MLTYTPQIFSDTLKWCITSHLHRSCFWYIAVHWEWRVAKMALLFSRTETSGPTDEVIRYICAIILTNTYPVLQKRAAAIFGWSKQLFPHKFLNPQKQPSTPLKIPEWSNALRFMMAHPWSPHVMVEQISRSPLPPAGLHTQFFWLCHHSLSMWQKIANPYFSHWGQLLGYCTMVDLFLHVM